ncbi:Microcin-E9 immunity protein [Delftia tsuruhatensis]|uniref:bacteriocin immunity protein n=1 Tax=Delftia tsuruhatensis TaxID=180282 RepID=UPI001E7F725C|nr:bacteriocin immunity protein [Delftia tsuruhatensis]CAB5670611.1 Microcin-E9 immunity protein [Delftia tsuruhatensis]CAC9683046.1 Microcin-E9 immunity protein [Delftia tsuruhatensis]
MELKRNLSDYTEQEFIIFIHAILNWRTEDERSELIAHFNSVVPHPDGSDLIYYPQVGADDSPEGITAIIKAWCATNRLPGFKSA